MAEKGCPGGGALTAHHARVASQTKGAVRGPHARGEVVVADGLWHLLAGGQSIPLRPAGRRGGAVCSVLRSRSPVRRRLVAAATRTHPDSPRSTLAGLAGVA